jgi:hypothetical protein
MYSSYNHDTTECTLSYQTSDICSTDLLTCRSCFTEQAKRLQVSFSGQIAMEAQKALQLKEYIELRAMDEVKHRYGSLSSQREATS